MINFGYLGEARLMNFSENALKMLIVRSPSSGVPNDFNHFPILSPSSNLFKNAMRWKNNNFREDERRELESLDVDLESSDAWWLLYKPAFEDELRSRGDVQQGVRILKDRVEKGKEVYLFCYCKELHRCHRLLVGEYLEEQGLEVNFREDEIVEEVGQLNMFG